MLCLLKICFPRGAVTLWRGPGISSATMSMTPAQASFVGNKLFSSV